MAIAQQPPVTPGGRLQLLIGVGHGVCTVATVSAAGQRFFVVGGRTGRDHDAPLIMLG